MKRPAMALWSALLMAALPALAQAAAEGAEKTGEHASTWGERIWGVPMIAWQIINLLLVIVLFIYLLRQSAPKFFRGRSADIKEQLDKAVRDKEEAVSRLREVDEKMAHLQDEIASIEEAARRQAQADKEKVGAEAVQARERVRQETSEEIERRILEAKRELKAYAADTAIAAAREVLAKDLTAEDEVRLRGRFLSQMEERSLERRG